MKHEKYSLDWHKEECKRFKSFLPTFENKLKSLAESIGLTVEELNALAVQKHLH